jgi:protein phosphatase
MTETATESAVTMDCFGLTDPGKVREGNEDHFLIAAVSKSVDVRYTSLSQEAIAHRFGAAGGYLFAVADGVAGRPEGDLASERTVAAVLGYVGQAAACFQGLTAAKEHDLLGKLEETIRGVHEGLLAEYGGSSSKVPATTLTLVLLVWPRAYLVHVGDSRAYVRRRGRLQRLTSDQTFGEYMVTVGAWTEAQAARSGSGAALSSAVGGSEILPVVGLVDLEPGDSLLLCTDGLTKHVSDDQIAAALASPIDAQTASRQLVAEALAGGGTDNVTVVVVKTALA